MKIDLRDWMTGIPDDSDLFALAIPGTHDCATRYVQLRRWACCQDKSVYDQLCAGVRALDIRVCPLPGARLGLVHGIARVRVDISPRSRRMEMGDVLEQCYRFLDEHPGECIILQFKNDNGKDNEQCFDSLLHTYIEGNADRWYLRDRMPTVGDARGRIVLVRRCRISDIDPTITPHNTGIDFSAFVEQDALVPEPLPLHTGSEDDAVFIIQDRFKYRPQQKWERCAQPFLSSRTPHDSTYGMCYLSTAGGAAGPRRNAQYVNRRFMSYDMERGVRYGIIYLDFATEELAEKIICNNF